MLDVTIAATGERFGRPPLIRLLVTVTAINSSSETRWILISSALGPGGRGGGVDKVERLSVGGITIGRFLGTGGFYAMALRPGARLTIKNLEIAWWNDPEASTPPPIDVRIAGDVTLGGAAIATWFEADASVAGNVEIDAALAIHTSSRHGPGGGEVAVDLIDGRIVNVPIAR